MQGAKVMVRSEYSLLSNGTERTIFQRQFDSGTHWDRWVRYPFFPGYATVGTIMEVGPEVSPLNLGQRIAIRAPHASHHVVGLHACVPIPDSITFEDAVWFALGKIGLLATCAAEVKSGTRVLVVGGGPIAQMVIRWVTLGSASTVGIVTSDPLRSNAAKAGGATVILNGHSYNYSSRDIEKTLGGKPQVVLDCTDSIDVLAWALGVVADYGKVVLIGDPGSPHSWRLTSDVLLRAITVTGVHDHNTYGQWTGHDVSRMFFEKVSSGQIRLDGLCTHTFSPDDALKAYTLLGRREKGVLGIRFDWRGQ